MAGRVETTQESTTCSRAISPAWHPRESPHDAGKPQGSLYGRGWGWSGVIETGRTHLLTVSESPITVRECFGLVIATIFRQPPSPERRVLEERPAGMMLTVEPPLLSQESHFAFRIAPDEAEYHGRLLAALEAVDATQFNAGMAFLERREQTQLQMVSGLGEDAGREEYGCRKGRLPGRYRVSPRLCPRA